VPWTPATLDPLPRLGWADAPTPVTELNEAAEELGFAWFGVKRDDLLGPLQGGTKVRKLDSLLATEPFASAARWASVGAIGSGHLVALTLAAEALERRLVAHCFWEEPTGSVLANLACIASGPTDLRYRDTRAELALRAPWVIRGLRAGSTPCIAPGASVPEGVVGTLRGGLELGAQISAGEVPAPDVVFVPWGTGGTAVGVALGLALAGHPTPVRAVAVVERVFSRERTLHKLHVDVLDHLRWRGLPVPDGLDAPDVQPVRGFLGKGYGHETPESVAAIGWLAKSGPEAEPIYGGKTLAAMRAEAGAWRGRRVLHWLTSHRGSLPSKAGWRGRLPPRLRRRLAAGPGWSRRRVLVAASAGVAAIVALRHVGYDGLEDWDGLVLSRREALVVAAAAEAVVPDAAGPLPARGPSPREVVAAIDRYLAGMSSFALMEIHGMFELLEQGTALDGRVRRLTNLEPGARRRFLRRLQSLGSVLGDAARGVRDLCLLGWYQDSRTWAALGYDGPLVPRGGIGGPGRYDSLVAPPGAEPRGAVR